MDDDCRGRWSQPFPHSRRFAQRMEDSMKPLAHLTAMLTGLVLLLTTITPSWGQAFCVAPGCNPTISDSSNNTAGGSRALGNLSTGADNTAFGRDALTNITTGSRNT